MNPLTRILPILLLLLCPSFAEDAPEAKEKESPKSEKIQEPVSKTGMVKIEGEEIPYTVTTGKIILKDDDGKPKASIFHVSYVREKTENLPDRPVMFAFNGGPGSSSVWLHLGLLGRSVFPFRETARNR